MNSSFEAAKEKLKEVEKLIDDLESKCNNDLDKTKEIALSNGWFTEEQWACITIIAGAGMGIVSAQVLRQVNKNIKAENAFREEYAQVVSMLISEINEQRKQPQFGFRPPNRNT